MIGFAIAAVAGLAFVVWENGSEHPMLDVAVFSNARFSAASASITAAFFALFGFIFTVTQYLQFVKGYNTLETGVRTLPFAVATGFAAPIAVKMVRKIGTKYVVAAGLATMAVGFLVTSTFSATTTYTTIAASMVLLGGGLGLIMAPATESIMGSLPTEKAGVGSAVNDTTRQLGGTLGVAVIGSLFASAYGDKLTAGLRGLLPERAATAARSSIGAAYAVADAAPASARPMIRTRGYRAVFRATVPTGGLSSTSSPGTRTPASSSSSRSHRCSTRYSPRCGGRRSAGTATIQSVPSRRSSTATNEPSSTSPSQPQRDVVDAARPAPLTRISLARPCSFDDASSDMRTLAVAQRRADQLIAMLAVSRPLTSTATGARWSPADR